LLVGESVDVRLFQAVFFADATDGVGVPGRLLPAAGLVRVLADRVEVDVHVGVGPSEATAARARLELREQVAWHSREHRNLGEGTSKRRASQLRTSSLASSIDPEAMSSR
jgi:hypothetical protein